MPLIKLENDSLILNKITKRYTKNNQNYLEGICENANGNFFRLTWQDAGKNTDWNNPVSVSQYRHKKGDND